MVFLALLVPISVIGGIVYVHMNTVLETDINSINGYLLDRLYIQIENELNDLNGRFEQVLSGDTVGLFLMGSTTLFNQRMDEVFAANSLISRVYVRPSGTGLSLANEYEYPQFETELENAPVWEEKWIGRSEEELQVWDGPYTAPDGQVCLVFPGPAMSIRKSNSGMIFFEVSIQKLLDKVAGDVNTATKHLHFVTADGLDYINKKDYSEAGFFDEIVASEQREYQMVNIDNKKYLAFMRAFPMLNGYLLVLEDQKVAFQSRQDVSQTIIVVSIIAFILALLAMAVFVQYSLIKPLKVVQMVAGKVASGDLTVKAQLNRKDELGQLETSFNQMTNSLQEVIQLLIKSGDSVYRATKELFKAFQGMAASSSENNFIINELAKISESQSINLSETSHFAGEISTSINDFAGQMEDVKDNSNQVMHNADQGKLGISDALNTIVRVNKNVQQIMVGMGDLKTKSDEINEITDLINQITEQTNLLALNASIEAARAGEAGLGFAVVAQEIRNLAEQSRSATERIGNLINQVQTRVDQVSEEIQDQVDDFAEGVKLTEVAGDTFERIAQAVLASDQMINQMNSHIDKIKEAGESIARNISDVASQAEESAASAEEIAASSEENLKVVDQMSQLVTNLETLSEQMGELKSKFNV